MTPEGAMVGKRLWSREVLRNSGGVKKQNSGCHPAAGNVTCFLCEGVCGGEK